MPLRAGVGAAHPRVTAVVVTFNRQELLAECLAAVLGQTRPVDDVVVVDNASTDATPDVLRTQFPQVAVERLLRNTGGAGGFAHGVTVALERGAELIWLLDDDTVASPDTLAALLDARSAYAGPTPAVCASRVVWSDGRDHPMNTPRARAFARRGQRSAAQAVNAVPIRTASFVSILVSADAVRRSGGPRADYFIWNDDFEFTARLLRRRPGLLCRSSVVTHRTAVFGDTEADPGERFFYEVRNKIWTLTMPATFGPLERLLFTAATLARWVRTVARSRNRRVLWRALGRGLRDGVRSRPRPNELVLAGALPAGRT